MNNQQLEETASVSARPNVSTVAPAVERAYDTLFFDLDGTLLDSIDLIGRSVNYVCDQLGKPRQTKDQLKRFVGPPLVEGLGRYLDLDRAAAEQAVLTYREYYLPRQLEIDLYPGTRQALARLRDAGFKMAVTSAKIQYSVVETVRHLGIADYFEYLGGIHSSDYPAPAGERTLSSKSEVIGHAIEVLGGRKAIGRTVVIGDRYNDYEGAQAQHLPVIGVAWGAGSAEEFPGCPYVAAWNELFGILGA